MPSGAQWVEYDGPCVFVVHGPNDGDCNHQAWQFRDSEQHRTFPGEQPGAQEGQGRPQNHQVGQKPEQQRQQQPQQGQQQQQQWQQFWQQQPAFLWRSKSMFKFASCVALLLLGFPLHGTSGTPLTSHALVGPRFGGVTAELRRKVRPQYL